MNKIYNFFIFLYFPVTFIGFEATRNLDTDLIARIFHLPFILPPLFLFLFWRNRIENIISRRFCFTLILYLITIGINYKKNGISILLFMFIDILFFYYAIPSCLQIKDIRKRFLYLFYGFLASFLLIVVYPSTFVRHFYIGSLYNLTNYYESIAFVGRSTLDAPLVTGLIVLFACCFVNLRRGTNNNLFLNFKFLFVILLGFFYMLLILRRGPLVVLVISILVIYVEKYKFTKNVSLLIMPILIMPFVFWEPIIYFLYNYGILDFIVSKFSGRAVSDLETYFTATGRMSIWMEWYTVYDSFTFKNVFIGFQTLDEYFELLGAYGHFHNGFLQLFYDNGLLSVITLIFLILQTFTNLIVLAKSKVLTSETKFLWGAFIIIYCLTISESLFHGVYFSHLLFIALIVLIERLSMNRNLCADV